MMTLCLRYTDGWNTRQQAQVTWRSFVHDVSGLGIGDIFARITSETVRDLGPELRSAVLPRQQRTNRWIEAVLKRSRNHGLITDNITGPSFLMGIAMISRPAPTLPESIESAATRLVDRHLPAWRASGVNLPLHTTGENG